MGWTGRLDSLDLSPPPDTCIWVVATVLSISVAKIVVGRSGWTLRLSILVTIRSCGIAIVISRGCWGTCGTSVRIRVSGIGVAKVICIRSWRSCCLPILITMSGCSVAKVIRRSRWGRARLYTKMRPNSDLNSMQSRRTMFSVRRHFRSLTF